MKNKDIKYLDMYMILFGYGTFLYLFTSYDIHLGVICGLSNFQCD